MLIGADKTLTPAPIGKSIIAVAAAPTCFGGVIVISGATAYPVPPSSTIVAITPVLTVSIPHVAAAPTPPPPVIVIVGGTV